MMSLESVPPSRLHSHAVEGVKDKRRRNGGDPVTATDKARERVNAIFVQLPFLPTDASSRTKIAQELCKEGIDIWTADKIAWANEDAREEMKEFVCKMTS